MSRTPLMRVWLLVVAAVLVCASTVWFVSRPPIASAALDGSRSSPLLGKGDRIAWVGSSSTRIGVWPRTVEFLLRTRHPSLALQFRRFTTGGGTFATGLAKIDGWLKDFRPTVVVYNYGGNDAGAGWQGLDRFKDNMARSVARAREGKARVILVTPQAADVRKSGFAAAANRTLYAETMLDFGRERGWPVIDVHHPLEAMQRSNQRADPSYTILRDHFHLTDPAYIGWGYLFFDRLDLPFSCSAAALNARGQVTATENCEVSNVETGPGSLAFDRLDRVLPILPPGALPPRFSVPLEAHSRYVLAVSGLEPGTYEILCEGHSIGTVQATALAAGVNLNSLLLDGGAEAPWSRLARAIWDGRDLDQIGRTRWRFEVRKH